MSPTRSDSKAFARKSSLATLLEPFLISLGLALAVSYRFFEPIWQVSTGLLAVGSFTALAYLAGFVGQFTARRRGLARTVWITMIVSQPVLLTIWVLDLQVSRIAVLSQMALLFFTLAFAAMRVPTSVRTWVALVFFGVAAYPSLFGSLTTEESRNLPTVHERYVFSSYHDVSVTDYRILEGEQQDGGAMTLLPDGRVLLVAGSGESRLLDLSAGLESSPIDLRLPIDVGSYRAQASNPTPYYRITDVLYRNGHLLITYTEWYSDEDCYTLRLVEAEFDGSSVAPWATRFESQPCVELSSLNNQAGGKIAVLDPSHILLTLGTFARTWQEGADYGKILRLDTETWRPQVFTRGHRNPQGLLVVNARIWSTEHGPDGGDELNAIERSRDYGWPSVSYGTDYGKKTLGSGNTPGDHSGFEEPVYTWVPSVATSNLIRVADGVFPLWQGDLLIGSLSGLGHGRALFRVRLVDGRAVTVERIPMGSRIRDLIELPQGPLVLWDGRGGIQVVRPADHLFAQCSGCHGVRGDAHGVGPDLRGVVGSPVARHRDFEYSEAMREYGGRWTETRLDRFLESPRDEIPGSTMEHDGIDDERQRGEIIKFLKEIRAGGP